MRGATLSGRRPRCDQLARRTLDVAFGGDETWGDFGVNVIVTDGAIVDSYGGD